MSPPALLAGDPPGTLFRRFARAPDYDERRGGAVLATWGAASVALLAGGPVSPELRYDRTAPWVSLPYPAMDIAWCPFKSGFSYASFLSVCRSCPVQLWDIEDASLHASYCATNALGMPAQPHCALWSPRREPLAVGYGGPGDAVHVRLYDVLREGDTAMCTYQSPLSKGIVSALADAPASYEERLLIAGFIRSGNMDIVDTRSFKIAAVLRGLRSGVAQVSTHPKIDHLVFAAGRLGDRRIVCWDIRHCTKPLYTYTRAVRTQQLTQFGFVAQRGSENSAPQMKLVSATHDGGLLVFPLNPGPTEEPRRVQKEVGPTTGLTVLSEENGLVAAAVGERQFVVRDRYEERAEGCVEEGCPGENGIGKRRRTPLEVPELEEDTQEAESVVSGIAVLSV